MNMKYSSWRKFYLEENKDIFLILWETCLIMTEIDFARYLGDHTPSVSNYSKDDAIKLLEDESLNLFKRFIGNPLGTNNNKYYLMTNMKVV